MRRTCAAPAFIACRRPPPVVLSDDLVRDPEGMLRALCAALDLPFQPQMLSWQAGPKPYDGVWAPWWYGQTHKSTGVQAAASGLSARIPPQASCRRRCSCRHGPCQPCCSQSPAPWPPVVQDSSGQVPPMGRWRRRSSSTRNSRSSSRTRSSSRGGPSSCPTTSSRCWRSAARCMRCCGATP